MTSSEFKAALDYCIPVKPNKVGLTYRTLNRRGMEYTPLMEEFQNGNPTGKYCSSIMRDGKIDPLYVEVDQTFLDERLKSC